MKLASLFACCALGIAASALAQPPGSEPPTTQAQKPQRPAQPSAQDRAVPRRSGSSSVPGAGASLRPPQARPEAQPPPEAVPRRDVRTPPSGAERDTRVARPARTVSCSRQADVQHLRGPQRSRFLTRCRRELTPR